MAVIHGSQSITTHSLRQNVKYNSIYQVGILFTWEGVGHFHNLTQPQTLTS